MLTGCPRPPANAPPVAEPASMKDIPAAGGTAANSPTALALPREWRSDASVAYACRDPRTHRCEEWLVTNPRVGSPAEAYCAAEERTDGPCPKEEVVGVCDDSLYFGTLSYSYAPNEPDDAKRRCKGRFWPALPRPGEAAVFDEPSLPADKPGCVQESPPSLETGKLCLDLPDDLLPAVRQDPRYDPPLNPPAGRTLVGHFMAGSFHQVFVYRRSPLHLEPSCPDTPRRGGVRSARDANFVQIETSQRVQGERLEMACLSPASLPDPATRMCTEGTLRWCDES